MAFIPIIGALEPIISKILHFIPDPQQKLDAQMQLMSALHQWDADQNAVNAEEAKNSSVFVAGWRPFIGWICGFALAYKFIIQPFLVFAIIVFGIEIDIDDLPVLDWGEMSTILLGMLGLGGLRTLEKVKGV